jgi:precorrin-6B methylase 2
MATQQTITHYEDIDWRLLWRNSRDQKSWKSKGAKEWDKKAASFTRRNLESPYIELFLEHLKLDSENTVLDVGCGPGTLALPIARQVKSVTALDYSAGMLEELKSQAGLQNIDNISLLECSWEDDWEAHGITKHDIAIASRSMNIDNLSEGIVKLDAHARRQVIIVDRIAPSPFDPDAFSAIGRDFSSGPDYIYTLNMLYELGIHPTLSHIELPSVLQFDTIDQALLAYTWMFKELDSGEEQALEAFLHKRIIARGDGSIQIHRRFPQRWAFISWQKKAGSSGNLDGETAPDN